MYSRPGSMVLPVVWFHGNEVGLLRLGRAVPCQALMFICGGLLSHFYHPRAVEEVRIVARGAWSGKGFKVVV